jgi:transaldolase / glucose-6-phosphate isomerase
MSSANPKTAAEIESFTYSLPKELNNAVKEAQQIWDKGGNTERLWKKDPALWTNTDEGKWLGWLDIVDQQLSSLSKFKALAAEIAEDAFTHILLLGMGGSSLAPEVFSVTFGKQPGSPELLILDSTDPVYMKSLRNKIDPARTLFCVSSKSGTTLEPNIYMQYFFEETRKSIGDRAGHHFIAITDPGSKLEGVAEKLGFRRVYYGVPSIGGRYSALSDFGLVPHAAMGLDTEKLLKRTSMMVTACKKSGAAKNPGVSLGLILGTAATKFGRDKVTLVCSESVRDFGAWLEQLLAESTGKQGHGLIPVDREPLFGANEYGKDRVFAYIKFAGDNNQELDSSVSVLEKACEPVVRTRTRRDEGARQEAGGSGEANGAGCWSAAARPVGSSAPAASRAPWQQQDTRPLIPPWEERLHAVQDTVQAEHELVVGAVVGLEHPGLDEPDQRREPVRIGQLGQHPRVGGHPLHRIQSRGPDRGRDVGLCGV